ncbi:MAG: lipoyl synthase [Candidatus Hydrogenedentes bacterium]|nr:lipoyl synthase [Candidatus Hydrogenedentota bacterium]
MAENSNRSRFPEWLRCRLSCETTVRSTVATLERLRINTVCQSAHCPNIAECFSRRTATFLILGKVCTRSCRFCAVRKGEPEPLDADEPTRVALAIAALGLRHAVITSVTRDDLPDGGSNEFAETVRTIRSRCDGVTIEVLVPDFRGDAELIESVVVSRPDVFAHNVETVSRLYSSVRPGADYDRSLCVLEVAKSRNPEVMTKSGIMVGMGESWDEVVGVMKDLRSVQCNIFTVGQYLSPSREHYPVVEFVPPAVFADYATVGGELGFEHVASGPLVRSSYMADVAFFSAMEEGDWRDGVRSESAGYR